MLFYRNIYRKYMLNITGFFLKDKRDRDTDTCKHDGKVYRASEKKLYIPLNISIYAITKSIHKYKGISYMTKTDLQLFLDKIQKHLTPDMFIYDKTDKGVLNTKMFMFKNCTLYLNVGDCISTDSQSEIHEYHSWFPLLSIVPNVNKIHELSQHLSNVCTFKNFEIEYSSIVKNIKAELNDKIVTEYRDDGYITQWPKSDDLGDFEAFNKVIYECVCSYINHLDIRSVYNEFKSMHKAFFSFITLLSNYYLNIPFHCLPQRLKIVSNNRVTLKKDNIFYTINFKEGLDSHEVKVEILDYETFNYHTGYMNINDDIHKQYELIDKFFADHNPYAFTETFEAQKDARNNLENAINSYVKEKYDIYFNVSVEIPNDHKIYGGESNEFDILVVSDHLTHMRQAIADDIDEYAEQTLDNIPCKVKTMSFKEYQIYKLKNGIHKWRVIPKCLYDNDDYKFIENSDLPYDIYRPEDKSKAILYRNNILCLNLGYLNYDGPQTDPQYINRKLLPLAYIDTNSLFNYMTPICSNIENTIDAKDVYTRYTYTQHNKLVLDKINAIDVDMLYSTISKAVPKLIFFVNYVFHRLITEHLECGDFKISLIDSKNIELSYRFITKDVKQSFCLKHEAAVIEISTTLTGHDAYHDLLTIESFTDYDRCYNNMMDIFNNLLKDTKKITSLIFSPDDN